MEAVTFVITNTFSKTPQWADVRRNVADRNFIKNVIDFNTDNLDKSVKNNIIQHYLKNTEWDVEKIYKASQAAGPLALWVESQIRYADILLKVDPLK